MKNTEFLNNVFQHLLDISRGKCSITDDMVASSAGEVEQRILYGLLILHEDLELSKKDLIRAAKSEYQVKLLEEKNKELEQFNFIASHDLQEPLQTIQQFSKLLEEKHKGEFDEISDKYLEYLKSASNRMSDLIKNLLDYTRLGTNMTKTVVDYNQLIADILQDMQTKINDSNAKFILGDYPTISSGKNEMYIVLKNLIGNAIKYCPKNRDPEVTITASEKENQWEFAVKDNGIGIDRKYFDKIFRIFQRLHSQKEFSGSGIGLSNCKKIIELQGGKIWLDSILGKGTTIFFTVPT